MTLLTLPVELFYLLFSFLDQQDVSRVSRTCKKLKSIALPEVYRTLQWTWRVWANHDQKSVLSLRLLLRSLMENPQLGDYVKHVQLQQKSGTSLPEIDNTIWAPSHSPRVAPSELAHAKQWIEHFGLASPTEMQPALERVQPFYVASPDEWSEALRSGNYHAYFALALAFSPKLSSLVLNAERPIDSRFIGSLLSHAVGPDSKGLSSGKLPSYESLRHVRMETKNGKPAPFLDMYSVFYLPSLETLTIQLGSAEGFQWPSPWQNRPSLASITTLKITHSEATADTLERILSPKPPLKELLYTYTVAEELKGTYFDLSTLSRALIYVSTTLESLTLAFDCIPDADQVPAYSNGPFTGTLGSLHHFPHLTHLEIPFVMLTGWRYLPRQTRTLSSLLPPGLRHLCLTDEFAYWKDFKWDEPNKWLERIRDLLAEREGAQGGETAGLEKVHLKFWYNLQWGDDEKAVLESLYRMYGVKGVISKNP